MNVTNTEFRESMGLWLQRARDGEDVVIVDHRRKRSLRGARIKLVVLDIELDVDQPQEEEFYL